MFTWTILTIKDSMPTGIFSESLNEFRLNNENPYDSPLIQILQCCQEFGVLDIIKKMASETCGMMSKTMSKKLVRDKALGVQINQWHYHVLSKARLDSIRLVSPNPAYSIWWMISDRYQSEMLKS